MTDYSINLTIQSIWTITRILVDILFVWFIIYYSIKVVRNNNRTMQIFKGILLILVINFLSKIMGLTTVSYFSDLFINWGFLAIIIIFQPEIRGVLERIGKTNSFTKITTLLVNEKERLVEELYRAVLVLSNENIGALISIEQGQSLEDYIKTGIEVNSAVSKELLSSIFMTTTPLHDGAVIIQGNKIACASAYFPPTNLDLPSRYGARHRAALGISEVTDALTIVVSEETSVISIAEKGKIFAVDEEQLKDYLRKVILNDEIEIRENTKQRSSLFVIDEPEVVVDKEEEGEGFIAGLLNKTKAKTKSAAKKKKKKPAVKHETVVETAEMKVPRNNRTKVMQQEAEKKRLEAKHEEEAQELKVENKPEVKEEIVEAKLEENVPEAVISEEGFEIVDNSETSPEENKDEVIADFDAVSIEDTNEEVGGSDDETKA